MLHEVEHLTKHFFTNMRKDEDDPKMAANLLSELSARLDYSQKSWAALGPLHRLRRALLELTAAHLDTIGMMLMGSWAEFVGLWTGFLGS